MLDNLLIVILNYASLITGSVGAYYLQHELPDEVLLKIFSYLLEFDLCTVGQVCKRFHTIANDTELWKNVYQNVYEYDLPMVNPESKVYEFIQPYESEQENPWKESFKMLYRALHVRLGYHEEYENHPERYRGRNILFFNTIDAAYNYAEEEVVNPLILIHSGLYLGEFLVVDYNVTMLGAAPGNVADHVIIERQSESTIMFGEGARDAYLGYVTLKVSSSLLVLGSSWLEKFSNS